MYDCTNNEKLVDIVMWIELALSASFFIITIVTTYLVFCRREPGRRHFQVKLSLLLLSLVSLFYLIYFVLILNRHNENHAAIITDFWNNVTATMGDLFQILSDILFLYEYLTTALLMPIVLDPSIMQEARIRQKSLALLKRNVIYAFLSILIILWAVLSIITGKLFVRLTMFILNAIIFGFFTWSLLTIKRQLLVLSEDIREGIIINRRLLHFYLIFFLLESTLYLSAYVAFFLGKTLSYEDNYSS